MRNNSDHNFLIFISILVLVVTLRLSQTNISGIPLLVTGYAAFASSRALGDGLWASIITGGPRQHAKVPPPWLIAWGVVLAVALLFGTPHVYVRNDNGLCTYLGWNGQITSSARYGCKNIVIAPLWDK